jgi:pyruvate/2-oxoacid:ferredoxin oxidoreductase alpha subunit
MKTEGHLMKHQKTGNEALAAAPGRLGYSFRLGIPRTPSTEIMENNATYNEIRWNGTQEKLR